MYLNVIFFLTGIVTLKITDLRTGYLLFFYGERMGLFYYFLRRDFILVLTSSSALQVTHSYSVHVLNFKKKSTNTDKKIVVEYRKLKHYMRHFKTSKLERIFCNQPALVAWKSDPRPISKTLAPSLYIL